MSSNTQQTSGSNYLHFKRISWRKFVTFLVAANIVTVILPWVVYGLTAVIPTGESGWGYALLIFALWGLGGVIVVANIVAACTYLVTKKAKGKFFLLNILTIIASMAYLVIVFGRWLFFR